MQIIFRNSVTHFAWTGFKRTNNHCLICRQAGKRNAFRVTHKLQWHCPTSSDCVPPTVDMKLHFSCSDDLFSSVFCKSWDAEGMLLSCRKRPVGIPPYRACWTQKLGCLLPNPNCLFYMWIFDWKGISMKLFMKVAWKCFSLQFAARKFCNLSVIEVLLRNVGCVIIMEMHFFCNSSPCFCKLLTSTMQKLRNCNHWK